MGWPRECYVAAEGSRNTRKRIEINSAHPEVGKEGENRWMWQLLCLSWHGLALLSKKKKGLELALLSLSSFVSDPIWSGDLSVNTSWNFGGGLGRILCILP